MRAPDRYSDQEEESVMPLEPKPIHRALAAGWDDHLCDLFDTGVDLADLDAEELLLQRKAFYLGALAALAALHNGARLNDLLDEIWAVFPHR
jgi:hypothetical protein